MADKYLVDLTEEEQGYLLDVIHKGKTAARRVARAHVLLRAAEGTTDEDIAKTLHLVDYRINSDRSWSRAVGWMSEAKSTNPQRASRKVDCATLIHPTLLNLSKLLR